jgi:hypothetical protein
MIGAIIPAISISHRLNSPGAGCNTPVTPFG